MIGSAISGLVQYAVRAGLLEECDETWAVNTLLGILERSAFDPAAPAENAPLHELLNTLTDDAVRRGVIEDGIASRDLFDTRLMGAHAPSPPPTDTGTPARSPRWYAASSVSLPAISQPAWMVGNFSRSMPTFSNISRSYCRVCRFMSIACDASERSVESMLPVRR